MNAYKIYVTAISLSIITYLPLVLFPEKYSEDVSDVMEWHGFGALLPNWLYTLESVLLILLPLAMLSFSRSIRLIYTGFWIMSLLLVLLKGVSVSTATEGFYGAISSSADLVILVLAYTSLDYRFGKGDQGSFGQTLNET